MGRNNPAEAKGKTERQQTILRLIQEHPISRQEVLLEHLRQEGFEVTQATISRDIREYIRQREEFCLLRSIRDMIF